MSETPLPRKATRAEFARISKRDPAWISRLERAGRLVIDPADDMVLVAESLQAIEVTAGGRIDVADRHQRDRETRDDTSAQAIGDAAHRRARADAELRIKQAEADRAELARDREAGELVAVEDAKRAMLDLATVTRMELQEFADRVAPLIAKDADEIREITPVISAEADACLRRISETLAKHASALPKPVNR